MTGDKGSEMRLQSVTPNLASSCSAGWSESGLAWLDSSVSPVAFRRDVVLVPSFRDYLLAAVPIRGIQLTSRILLFCHIHRPTFPSMADTIAAQQLDELTYERQDMHDLSMDLKTLEQNYRLTQTSETSPVGQSPFRVHPKNSTAARSQCLDPYAISESSLKAFCRQSSPIHRYRRSHSQRPASDTQHWVDVILQ